MQAQVPSPLLDEPRTVWVEPPEQGLAETCLIFLDGELYRNGVSAPAIVRQLQLSGDVPAVTSVYVSNLSAAARHCDFTCRDSFSLFLARDLKDWIEKQLGRHRNYIVCGLSLSGLAAAFTLRQHPSEFRAALCQSPSAWWHGEWLAASWPVNSPCHGRYWISVGDQERQVGSAHAPTGLFQNVSQLDSCRRLARTLIDRGHEVCYSEYIGGHDMKCWQKELPDALKWLLAGPASPANDDPSEVFSRV